MPDQSRQAFTAYARLMRRLHHAGTRTAPRIRQHEARIRRVTGTAVRRYRFKRSGV